MAASSELSIPLLTSLETSFNGNISMEFVDSIKSTSVYASVLYVILIISGQHVMKSRPPWSLRGLLAAWNVLLAGFSIIGAIRCVPELVGGVLDHGWTHSLCSDASYMTDRVTGVWAFLFTMSKMVELGDTAFIVLRKQPLQFLHWYHHITVMIYCFYSYPLYVASGRYYLVMNYCVHSLMYSYYALKSLRVFVPRFVNVMITSLQITQMIAGLSVALAVGVLKMKGQNCLQSNANVIVTILMYISYFILFVQFFYRTYAAPSKTRHGGGGDAARKPRQETNGKTVTNGTSAGPKRE